MTDSNPLKESEILASFAGAAGSSRSHLQVQILSETPSTNTEAFKQGREGAPDATVIFAEKQTAGRGRKGRSWDSPPAQNLYFSILLKPTLKPHQCTPLTLVAGLACFDVMKSYVKEDLSLKWPNDLWVNRKKLGGLLTEMETLQEKVSFVVVGIGLNINSKKEDFSKEVGEIATSLFLETGKIHSRSSIAGELLTSFFSHYETFLKEGFPSLKLKWEAASKMKGEKVKVEEDGRSYEGICEGLDESGFLLVRTKSGVETVVAGDVIVCS